jgi:hypothetical protein
MVTKSAATHPTWGQLTPHELQIAQMTAEGLTNRENRRHQGSATQSHDAREAGPVLPMVAYIHSAMRSP